jgi:heme exporter protein A
MTNEHRLPPRQLTVTDLASKRGERVLFEGVGFALAPGRALVLRGPNGVGKTTLLMALAGVVTPFAGRVAIGGRGEEDGPDLGLLFYRSGLKARLTVLENLKFWVALDGGDDGAIGGTLETVGLGGLEALDAGFLSSGQLRRLALARLLLAERPVWLLDEPTAALDAEGEALVGRLIDKHLDRGGLVVAATHHDLGLGDAGRVETLRLEALA